MHLIIELVKKKLHPKTKQVTVAKRVQAKDCLAPGKSVLSKTVTPPVGINPWAPATALGISVSSVGLHP